MILAFISETLTYVIKGGAAVVGLVIGWFITGPIANVLSRLAFQRPVAPALMPWLRGLGALGCAALAWFLVGLAGGDGSGPGPGGGKDKGKDRGDDKGLHEGKDKGSGLGGKEAAGKDKKTVETPVDLLRVEMIGGARYKKDERWYLFQERGAPLRIGELRERVREHLAKKELKSARLQPVVVGDTVGNWREALLPHLEDLARELKLSMEPPDTSAVKD